ncbi:hypothetical protein [Nakamurella sp.]|uniref:hypothetical protein n=1 Tax=Nakamurella sp. TaxID=1869182 RepID=UPI00378425B9
MSSKQELLGAGNLCRVQRRFYFAALVISPAVATKIQSKHGVTPDEVREALDNYERARWHYSDEHGLRLLVIGQTSRGRTIKIVLQPVHGSQGDWRLRTAMPSSR